MPPVQEQKGWVEWSISAAIISRSSVSQIAVKFSLASFRSYRRRDCVSHRHPEHPNFLDAYRLNECRARFTQDPETQRWKSFIEVNGFEVFIYWIRAPMNF